MGYLDYAGLQYLWGKLKEKFSPKSHSHDDRYYTEAEVDGKLNSKVNNNEAGANGLFSKLTTSWTATPTDDTYFIRQDTGGGNQFGRVKFSTLWNYIKGKTDGVYQPKGSYAASEHTHDDRYYTESEMNAKLAEKSNINHTHNIIKDIGDGRNIKIAYSKSGLDYGNYSWLAGWNGEELRAVNKNQFATADHTHLTSSISGGNVNYAGWAGPIESAHIDVLRANRLAFLPAYGVKVEYSVDGGTTWVDYGATDDQKASLFAMRMGSAASFYTGKHTKAAECTTKDQLRITVTPVDRYAFVNMLYLWVSVAGTSATVNISRSTIGAKETFTDVRTDVPISGWNGPNEIRFSGGTFGGGSTQTSNAYAYRFTFKNKADGKGSISVMDIRMYGPSAWGVPNSMMEKDHIYNWDINQNVQFPAQVTATKFNGSSTGVVDYGDSSGPTIKVGFGGAGLTKDKLTHIAGYAKDGNQTVIKDVSRGVLQSWLNLNEMINTQLTTGSSTPSDNDFYISQYAGGGATTTTYHRRPISALWNYIKSKADGVYQPKGNYSTADTKNTAGSTNTTSKLYLIGATSQSANPQTYSNTSVYTTGSTIHASGFGNDIFIIYPSGGFASYGGQQIGYCKITLPTLWDSTMMTFTVTIYNYVSNTSVDYRISGYNYSGKPWYNCAAICVGKAGTSHSNLSVRFGDNGTKNVITIGEEDTEWEYPRIVVHDVVIGNSNFETYKSGWNVEISKSGAPNVSETISNTHVGYNAVTSWDKIQNKPSSFTPASHTHDDRYYTETEMNTKLNGKANSSHTHTKSQITDFPASLKNPTALTIQTNGTTAAIYDGSAAKTVNITKSNIGLGNVDNTADANKSVKYATSAGNASTATKAISADKATSASSADKAAKLTTARTVSGGSDIMLSFNYDGSGNSTANIGFYSCKHSIGNTNNYPFHRFAKLDANKNAWVDNSMTFLISQDYSGGGYGICRLVYRSNADSSSASLAAEWLVRKGLSVDTVQVAIKTDKTNGAYCDAFYKSSGGYMSVVIRAIASGGRASLGRTWTLINSNETYGTTATDKKTSSECWKTIADAGNELHKQAYSSSASAIDGGYVASAGSANSASTCTGNSASATKLTSSAGSATQPVYFKDGKPVAGTYTLGDASSKMVRTLSAQGNSGWANQTTDDKYVPTMSFMAYWNGAYGGTASNLQYCDRGRFGTIVTKGSGDYAAANHTHDDRYYTESEVNTKLANYQPKGNYAAASHTHNYAGSGSAGGSANSAIKLDSSAGSATQPVYFKDGKPVATTYALNKTVPADAKFTDTNTWRGIQNNLTSDSTDQSLSAAQGKALKTLVDGKAPTSHKHTKSQITDFPTSMPASDVSAWAKAATKPSYTKAEVGLSNVDNTADKDKSVKYAVSAGSASQLNGFTIQASTSDLTAGSSKLSNNVIYIVYE